jgi:S-adenosylmethionine:tRNA ribosyltransferase-isomerase
VPDCTFAPMIALSDYTYDLPDERIARYPLAERDQSRLLVYDRGQIRHNRFTDLPHNLPAKSRLFFNDTKVIPARLLFQKDTGATIEVFLLDPVEPTTLVQHAMETTGEATWRCAIGNLKRWPNGVTLKLLHEGLTLEATLADRERQLVHLCWQPATLTFAEVMVETGKIPLPPYLHREAEASDRDRYQTIYSRAAGAVAAPTAGLHFTGRVLESLDRQGFVRDFLTLHVSAGTFQPVKVTNAAEHLMHAEQVIVTRHNIETLMGADGPVIAVGTTSMRTLESLYWYGVKLMQNPEATFAIGQTEPYQGQPEVPRETALEAVWQKMQQVGADRITGSTSIYIMPGYRFRISEGLITNFHQPASTLLLLIAAFIGEDWRTVYRAALDNGYRFLSYGDSSLLMPGIR